MKFSHFRHGVCASAATLAVLASPSPAGAAVQEIDASIRVDCSGDSYNSAKPWRVRIQGTAPTSAATGDRVVLSDLRATLTLGYELTQLPTYPPPPPATLYSSLQSLSFASAGTAQSAVAVGGLPAALPTVVETSVYAADWNPSIDLQPVAFDVQQGADPIAFALGGLSYQAAFRRGGPAPSEPIGPTRLCTPLADQPPVAVIERVAPVLLPVVRRVSGFAFGGVGGVLQLSGPRLAGTRVVRIGDRAVRPLFSTSTAVWLVAPPLPRGTYPVSVVTAAGTSAPAPSAMVTYR